MSLTRSKLAAATAVAAAFSMSAAPVTAAELPRAPGQAQPWNPDALDAANHRHHGHYDDDWDIDGDDVLAGVLILGGIAAIAGIARAGQRRAPEPARYPEDPGYRDEPAYVPPRDEGFRSGGMAQAVDSCVAEVEAERGAVSAVDRAARSGDGWYVAGELDGGRTFACWTDGAGQVRSIEAGETGASYEREVPGGSYSSVEKQSVEGGALGDGAYALAQAAE